MDYRPKHELTIETNDSKHFPVFTPGLGNKELVEDHGLKQAMSYIDMNPDHAPHLTIEYLCQLYPKEMIMEMVDFIKTKIPDASETQIVMTILSTL